MSVRRHRLSSSEIPEVILGLRLRLMQLLEERRDSETAEVGLRCLRRLLGESQGRPKYGAFSWDRLDYELKDGEDHALARIEEIRGAQRSGSQPPARS